MSTHLSHSRDVIDLFKDGGSFKDHVSVSESDDKATGDDGDGGWQSEGVLFEHKEMATLKLLRRGRGRGEVREEERGKGGRERERKREGRGSISGSVKGDK